MRTIATIFFIIIFIIGLSTVINKTDEIVNPENIKFSYVIPLPTGAIVTEIDYSVLQTIEIKYKEFVSKIPFIENEIVENNPFLIEFSIVSPSQRYENITLKVEHSSILQNIQVSDKARNPLPKSDNDIFIFQKDLFPGDITYLILTGIASNLGDEPYSGANIKINVFSHGREVFNSKDKTLKVCKENIEGGCSNRLKQMVDLFNTVFFTNTTINKTNDLG